jgi:hypothetical protein
MVLEHSEAAFGAANCGCWMTFCSAGRQAMKRSLKSQQRPRGYGDDLVTGPKET